MKCKNPVCEEEVVKTSLMNPIIGQPRKLYCCTTCREIHSRTKVLAKQHNYDKNYYNRKFSDTQRNLYRLVCKEYNERIEEKKIMV